MVTKFRRLIKPQIEEALGRGKSILLLGPRQTGKTTLVETFDFDLAISFLQNKTRIEFEKNPDLIASYVHGIKKKKRKIPLVIIDEVQKVPQVMDPIQSLIDKKVAQFIITGSSARKLKQQSDLNLLPGRVIYFRMDPLTYVEAAEEEIDSLLSYGSLPEIILTKEKKYKEESLLSYVEIYLEEEIRKEAVLRKLPDFIKFLELSAIESGNVINFSAIASDIGISHLTVKSYFDILQTTLIGEIIQPITESNTRKKLIKAPKFLFFDLGVRRIAANEGVPFSKDRKGQVFEQFVGLELLRYIRTYKKRIDLNYWQDPQSAEVDWVLRKGKTYIPIEVKLTQTPTIADAKHLSKFLNEYNCPQGAYIICNTDVRLKIAKNITAISWREIADLVNDF